ncbi:MAG: hypothetical protein H6Q33_5216 [Deltaproteobacteria bacterium]|nr:hypothetical protein [Deltaproteobacteria bacterium]
MKLTAMTRRRSYGIRLDPELLDALRTIAARDLIPVATRKYRIAEDGDTIVSNSDLGTAARLFDEAGGYSIERSAQG